MVRVASHMVTPTQGLVELNKSAFMSDGHAPYKMDKFRKILTDPFYARILIMDKQVKVRNEYGLHEGLITKEQHLSLVKIMENKKKNQGGPRKNGNPDYPLSNHVSCSQCKGVRNGRYVGFKHSNGKNVHFYHKYRCRSCRRYVTRDSLHTQIENHFEQRPITDDGINDLLEAIDIVWKEKEGQADQEAFGIKRKIRTLTQTIEQQVEAATDPANYAIKEDILASIGKKKKEITDLEEELTKIKHNVDADKDRFIRFAFNFVDRMGGRFLEISPENRLRCKLILFPAGFWIDAQNKVYTPEISPLYGLATNKKDAEASLNSHLVRVTRL
ncbi:MAG TPA: hypothetical protein VFT87_05655 [Candidatus Saccharimonadales bacterium]|nr:hypothetical protein [Candidatus Saccharimonadales bacterium]